MKNIAILGMGYVGLPLSFRFLESGLNVIGLDIDEAKVQRLSAGESYISHIPHQKIAWALENGFEASSDFSKISEVDAILLCVPTPLNKYREPDLSYVISTIESITPYLKKNQIISLESTTYPGTTREEIVTRVEKAGYVVGEDIFIVYSPEREDPGNQKYNTQTIPKVIGGITKQCLEKGVELYSKIIDQVVPVSSVEAAELTKLLENIYRAVNIGLANEMKIIADKMNIDIHEVIKAAGTKPFGFTPYYPGPGLGGHCIPIDPFYLTWKAREYGLHTRFIELAGEVNASMPKFVMEKLVTALNNRGKPVNDAKILLLGLAYKKNVDDLRESPSLELLELMNEKGAKVDYSDPYFPTIPKLRKYSFSQSSVNLTDEVIKGYDCVLLATDHDDFDYKMILQNAQLIVDTRGVFLEKSDNVVKA